ncbi:hypothetical protein BJX66DRAFT_171960 [Aspergillus keveii]|uniref:Uncharacterized protein n=1 Tax=Aspergillus keveii TaxID=714993 RepID=A0ABR4G8J9_9EURO
MTRSDPSPPDSPKPAAPVPCTHNCGVVALDGVHWRDWTCRCGYGYFTPERRWISGYDVRHGLAPPREQQTGLQHGASSPCRDREAQRPLLVSSPSDADINNDELAATRGFRPQEISSHSLHAASHPRTSSWQNSQHDVQTPAVAGTSNMHYISPSSNAPSIFPLDTANTSSSYHTSGPPWQQA